MFNKKQFQKKLLTWFATNGRKNLPWQQNKTPYRVWVSEIMLQQTQVATVIPYFEHFMKTFPTLEELAKADIEKVLHCWTGLGYYTRARNLHQTAKKIVNLLGGEVPDDMQALLALPGIGQSTAAAILASAFNKKATILDGNVKRVLARLYAIQEPINQKNTEKKLWALAETLTPAKDIGDYTQAIMDLGATICTRAKPLCDKCPLSKGCHASQENLVTILPKKINKKPLPIKKTTLIILQYQNKVFLKKRNGKGVWQGLWCFPEYPEENPSAIKKIAKKEFDVAIAKTKILAPFRHTFTHYHLDILPVCLLISRKQTDESEKDALWYELDHPQEIGLPQPVKKILAQL